MTDIIDMRQWRNCKATRATAEVSREHLARVRECREDLKRRDAELQRLASDCLLLIPPAERPADAAELQQPMLDELEPPPFLCPRCGERQGRYRTRRQIAVNIEGYRRRLRGKQHRGEDPFQRLKERADAWLGELLADALGMCGACTLEIGHGPLWTLIREREAAGRRQYSKQTSGGKK